MIASERAESFTFLPFASFFHFFSSFLSFSYFLFLSSFFVFPFYFSSPLFLLVFLPFLFLQGVLQHPRTPGSQGPGRYKSLSTRPAVISLYEELYDLPTKYWKESHVSYAEIHTFCVRSHKIVCFIICLVCQYKSSYHHIIILRTLADARKKRKKVNMPYTLITQKTVLRCSKMGVVWIVFPVQFLKKSLPRRGLPTSTDHSPNHEHGSTPMFSCLLVLIKSTWRDPISRSSSLLLLLLKLIWRDPGSCLLVF